MPDIDWKYYWPAIVTQEFWLAVVKIIGGGLGTLALTAVVANGVAWVLAKYGVTSFGNHWTWTCGGLFFGTVLYAARNRWHADAGWDAADLLSELESIQLDLNGQTLDGKTVFGAYGGVFQDMTSLEGWIRTIAISAAPIETTRRWSGVSKSVSAASIHSDPQIEALAAIVRLAAGHGVLFHDQRDESLPMMKVAYKLTDPKGLQAQLAAARATRKKRPDLELTLSPRQRW